MSLRASARKDTIYNANHEELLQQISNYILKCMDVPNYTTDVVTIQPNQKGYLNEERA